MPFCSDQAKRDIEETIPAIRQWLKWRPKGGYKDKLNRDEPIEPEALADAKCYEISKSRFEKSTEDFCGISFYSDSYLENSWWAFLFLTTTPFGFRSKSKGCGALAG